MRSTLNNQFQLISVSQCSCLGTAPEIGAGGTHFSTSWGKRPHRRRAEGMQGAERKKKGLISTAVPPQFVNIWSTLTPVY